MTKPERSKWKKHPALWRRLLLGLLGVILGINIYLANAGRLLGNTLPMPFGYGAAVVLSGSMEPTFSRGDLILVKQTDSFSVGDIVVYQTEGILVVHRVIELDGDTVITQGDANSTSDPVFEKSAVKGTVIGWVPRVGILVNALKTPVGMILVLVCALLMIELSFQKQKEKDEKELEAIKEEIRRLRSEGEDQSEGMKTRRK